MRMMQKRTMEKTRRKTPAKSSANKSSPATKSADKGEGKEKKKDPPKTSASALSLAKLSATDPFNCKERGKHPNPRVSFEPDNMQDESDDDGNTTMDSGSQQQRPATRYPSKNDQF